MDQAVVRESTTRLHYESVKRAIAAMRMQMGQPLSLHSLAKIGFASPYHFTRTFRSVTGLPPLHFLSALRLDAARTLLLHTRSKVIDICYEWVTAASALSPGDLPAPLVFRHCSFARWRNRRVTPHATTKPCMINTPHLAPVLVFQDV